MGIQTEKIEFYSEYFPAAVGTGKFTGIDWTKTFMFLDQAGAKHIKMTMEIVKNWDIAPMRGYLHAAIIPAFTRKYNETTPHPDKHFHTSEIKGFLKAKFLGWNEKAEMYKGFGFGTPVKDMEHYQVLQKINANLKEPVSGKSTEALTPENYWIFLDTCEKYYFELFHETFDTKTKPERTGNV